MAEKENVATDKTPGKKTYVCTEECFLNGTRYHVGDTVTTDAKLPDYWILESAK